MMDTSSNTSSDDLNLDAADTDAPLRTRSMEFEDWCREVARLQYEADPEQRVTYRSLMEQDYWWRAWERGIRPSRALADSDLPSTDRQPEGTLKTQPVRIVRTVVRS